MRKYSFLIRLRKIKLLIKNYKEKVSVNMDFIKRTKVAKLSSSHRRFCIKDVLKNFAKFTGKHLCQNLSTVLAIASEKAYQNYKVILLK